ncbi:MAG: DNA repair protein RadA [Oscillatoriales cyanobacterium]|nr:MAG: DNA repair protein RadA [Oscillatoriales cyanobacterium]
MAKAKTTYICSDCGSEARQYFGRCPDCGNWNTLVESIVETSPPPATSKRAIDLASVNAPKPGQRHTTPAPAKPAQSVRLAEMSDIGITRMSSGYAEFDRVLGGGIVEGSLVLVGGEPGIGKSTLLLQTASQLAGRSRVLYVSAEESGQQVKLRAQRILADLQEFGAIEEDDESPSIAVMTESSTHQPDKQGQQRQTKNTDRAAPTWEASAADFYLLPETDLETILTELESLQPQVAIIDSIQRIYFKALASAPGSVAQVRECTSALMQVAKRTGVSLFLVGHVTKDGAIAGPRTLEHLVDTVLFFEGDRFASHRLLRSMKNRFGPTHEIGVFEMVARGLREVANPSELFLSSRDEMVSGTATIVACEGTRPIVVEVQALVSPTSFGTPRRSTTGIESNRLQQILAVLEKRVGIPLSKLDTYVASVGGLRVEEPAADLGVAIAVVAAFRDRIVDANTVTIGEVGLGGQVRPVPQLELRLREAAKLGFRRAIVPRGKTYPDIGLEIIQVSRVLDAILAALPRDETEK